VAPSAVTDTFAGIAPADISGFMAAQIAGATAALFVMRWLNGKRPAAARQTGTAKQPIGAVSDLR